MGIQRDRLRLTVLPLLLRRSSEPSRNPPKSPIPPARLPEGWLTRDFAKPACMTNDLPAPRDRQPRGRRDSPLLAIRQVKELTAGAQSALILIAPSPLSRRDEPADEATRRNVRQPVSRHRRALAGRDAGAHAAITQPAYAELINQNCRNLRWLAVTSHDAGAPPAAGRGPDRASSFASLIADDADRPRRPRDPTAPACVQYTSGTTSRPKGVLWTHANALWGAKVNATHEDLRPDDVHLVFLPLFHTNAQAYSVLASLWAGATA